MRKRIIVDIDLTVVETARVWWDYLVAKSVTKIAYDVYLATYGTIPYDIAKLFPDVQNGHSFWYQNDLYDDLVPLPNAVKVLLDIKTRFGYEIVFCSHVCGGHYDSKIAFIDRFFPFADAIVITGEKFIIEGDLVVEDRNEYINMINATHYIKMDTPYEQINVLSKQVHTVSNWNQVLDFVEKLNGNQ